MEPASYFQFCPRCGSAAAGESGVRSFTCAACGFVLYFNAAVSAAALVLRPDDRGLFIRRAKDPAKGKLALVGGFVDPGETVEEALAREVREEVGIELASLTYFASFTNTYRYKQVAYPVADLIFVCRTNDPDAATALDDVASFVWLDPMRVDVEKLAFPSMRAAMARFQARATAV